MARPTDWDVLGLHKDPTPGDPARIRRVSKSLLTLRDAAKDIDDAMKAITDKTGSDAFKGKVADELRHQVGGRLRAFVQSLRTSFELASQSLPPYATVLEQAQRKADGALAQARGLSKKDPERDRLKHTAQAAGDAAKEAAKTATAAMRKASNGIKSPVSPCAEFWKIFQWIAIVLILPALVFGGPLALAAIGANLTIFVKTAVDFAQGKTNLLGLFLAGLGLIAPTTRAIPLGALSKAGFQFGKQGLGSLGTTMLTFLQGGARGFMQPFAHLPSLGELAAASGSWIKAGALWVAKFGAGVGQLGKNIAMKGGLIVVNGIKAVPAVAQGIGPALKSFGGRSAGFFKQEFGGLRWLRVFLPAEADEIGYFGVGGAMRIALVDRGLFGMFRFGKTPLLQAAGAGASHIPVPRFRDVDALVDAPAAQLSGTRVRIDEWTSGLGTPNAPLAGPGASLNLYVPDPPALSITSDFGAAITFSRQSAIRLDALLDTPVNGLTGTRIGSWANVGGGSAGIGAAGGIRPVTTTMVSPPTPALGGTHDLTPPTPALGGAHGLTPPTPALGGAHGLTPPTPALGGTHGLTSPTPVLGGTHGVAPPGTLVNPGTDIPALGGLRLEGRLDSTPPAVTGPTAVHLPGGAVSGPPVSPTSVNALEPAALIDGRIADIADMRSFATRAHLSAIDPPAPQLAHDLVAGPGSVPAPNAGGRLTPPDASAARLGHDPTGGPADVNGVRLVSPEENARITRGLLGDPAAGVPAVVPPAGLAAGRLHGVPANIGGTAPPAGRVDPAALDLLAGGGPTRSAPASGSSVRPPESAAARITAADLDAAWALDSERIGALFKGPTTWVTSARTDAWRDFVVARNDLSRAQEHVRYLEGFEGGPSTGESAALAKAKADLGTAQDGLDTALRGLRENDLNPAVIDGAIAEITKQSLKERPRLLGGAPQPAGTGHVAEIALPAGRGAPALKVEIGYRADGTDVRVTSPGNPGDDVHLMGGLRGDGGLVVTDTRTSVQWHYDSRGGLEGQIVPLRDAGGAELGEFIKRQHYPDGQSQVELANPSPGVRVRETPGGEFRVDRPDGSYMLFGGGGRLEWNGQSVPDLGSVEFPAGGGIGRVLDGAGRPIDGMAAQGAVGGFRINDSDPRKYLLFGEGGRLEGKGESLPFVGAAEFPAGGGTGRFVDLNGQLVDGAVTTRTADGLRLKYSDGSIAEFTKDGRLVPDAGNTIRSTLLAVEVRLRRLEAENPELALTEGDLLRKISSDLENFDRWMREANIGYRLGGSLSAYIQGGRRFPKDVDVEIQNSDDMRAVFDRMENGGWSLPPRSPDGGVPPVFTARHPQLHYDFDIVDEIRGFESPFRVNEGMQLEGAAVKSGVLMPRGELITNYLDRLVNKPGMAVEKSDSAQIANLLEEGGHTDLPAARRFWEESIGPTMRAGDPRSPVFQSLLHNIVIAKPEELVRVTAVGTPHGLRVTNPAEGSYQLFNGAGEITWNGKFVPGMGAVEFPGGGGVFGRVVNNEGDIVDWMTATRNAEGFRVDDPAAKSYQLFDDTGELRVTGQFVSGGRAVEFPPGGGDIGRVLDNEGQVVDGAISERTAEGFRVHGPSGGVERFRDNGDAIPPGEHTILTSLEIVQARFQAMQRDNPQLARTAETAFRNIQLVMKEFDRWMRKHEIGFRFGGSLSAYMLGGKRVPQDIDIDIANPHDMGEIYQRMTQPGSGWTIDEYVEGQAMVARHTSLPDLTFDISNELVFRTPYVLNESMQLQGAAVQSGGMMERSELILNYLDRILKKPAVAKLKADYWQISQLLEDGGIRADGVERYWRDVLVPMMNPEDPRISTLGGFLANIVRKEPIPTLESA